MQSLKSFKNTLQAKHILYTQKQLLGFNTFKFQNFKLNKIYINQLQQAPLATYFGFFKKKDAFRLNERDAGKVFQKGIERMNVGNIDGAEECFLEVIDLIKDIDKPNLGVVNSYFHLGNIQNIRKDLDGALSYYQKAVDFCTENFSPDSTHLFNVRQMMGQIYESKQSLNEALFQYERALEIASNAAEDRYTIRAVANNLVAGLLLKLGKPKEALVHYEAAFDYHKKGLGEDEERGFLGSITNNIGSIYQNQGEFAKALEWYEQSIDFRKGSVIPDQNAIVNTYLNIGSVYYNIKEYKNAKKSLESAFDFYQEVSENQKNKGLYMKIQHIFALVSLSEESSFEASYHYQKIVDSVEEKEYGMLSQAQDVKEIFVEACQYLIKYYGEQKKKDQEKKKYKGILKQFKEHL